MTHQALPISFLSDFGLADEFVGVVHGVLAKLAPDSRVIDVGHGTPRGDVRAAALALTRAIQYLPEGVALVVVDPGVGSERRALAVQTDWGYFVGPDNGVLSPAVAMMGGAGIMVSIDNPEARIPSPGGAFHGRDVFAPAAALLASGDASIEDLGPELSRESVQPLLLPLPETEGNVVRGEAWWVDRFGNVQTNIGPDDLAAVGLSPGSILTVKVGATLHTIPWATAYSDVEPGEALVHVDSAGLIAIAVREGAADETLNLSTGVAVTLAGRGSRPAG
ncbi:MAG: SAM hydrolase/SAM-dependent halogenase family protein [Acidimicrobiia bacterium]